MGLCRHYIIETEIRRKHEYNELEWQGTSN